MEHVQSPGIPTLEPPEERGSPNLFARYPWLAGARSGLTWTLIVGGVLYLIIASNIKSREQLQAALSPDRQEIDLVSDLRAVGYDAKGKTWELFSKAATEHREGAGTSEVKEVQVLNIYKDGKVNIYGQGDRGEYSKAIEELQLYDNVVLNDTDGTTTLVTNHLKWNNQTETLTCPDKVDVVIEDNHIVADALYADRDMTHLRFLGNVRMYVKGLEKESILTREGIVDPADAAPQKSDDGEDEGMWVAAQYIYYDKTNKVANCYPVITAQVRRELGLDKVTVQWRNQEEPHQVTPMERQIRTADAWLESTENKSATEIDLLFGPSIPPALKERQERQVLAWRKDKRLFADILDIDLREKRLDPREDVFFYAADLKDRVKETSSKTARAISKETTSVAGDYMRYFWKAGLLEGWDGVEMFQRDKRLEARHLVYHEEIGIMACDGDVVIHQSSGQWMEREGLLEDVTEEKAREDAKKPTTIYCNAALLYDEPGYLYCAGDVKVVQAEQRAWSDLLEYYDAEDWVTLTGNVDYSNSKGEVVKSEALTMYLDKSVYEVFKAAEVKIQMPEKYARQIDEAREDKE